MFCGVTQMKIVCKIYALVKLTYQLTTSGFMTLLAFHILWSCLWLHRQMHGVDHFHYYFVRREIFNGLFSDPNWDCMQNLCPRVVDVPTYHFRVHKTIGISSSRAMFMVQNIWRHDGSLFTIVLLVNTFPTVPWETQMEIIWKCYAPNKMTYQFTKLRFTKLLAFHIQG